MARRIGVVLGSGVLGILALAWWVLESSGVAVVETHRPDGGLRNTHVWYARVGDAIWLEAGRPDHPWYLDVQRDPRLILRAEDESGPFVAATVPGRQAHDFVRDLFRRKYGVRDWILDQLIDTSTSIAVRLTPRGAAPPGASPPPPGLATPVDPGPATPAPATGTGFERTPAPAMR